MPKAESLTEIVFAISYIFTCLVIFKWTGHMMIPGLWLLMLCVPISFALAWVVITLYALLFDKENWR